MLAQPVVSFVGDYDAGLLGVDGGVREVGGITQRASCDGLEKRRLTNVRETNLK